MAHSAVLNPPRPSRFWLYAPFLMLALVAAAWSVAWHLIRARTVEAFDGFLAAEAAAGRLWTCADRQVGGYPFRIELACGSASFRSGETGASFGRVRAVAQVYRPRHVIVEAGGPLAAGDGRLRAEGEWRRLRASLHLDPGGPQRISLIVDEPRLALSGAMPEPLSGTARRLEAHLRRSPARGSEGAYDLAATLDALAFAPLDALVGGTEPADLQIDLTATEARAFAGGAMADALDDWREAGGAVDVLMLSLSKGPRQLEAKGALRLDEARRPAGQLSLSGAGLDTLIGNLVGGRGAMLASALGQGARPPAAGGSGKPALSPLPPVRLEGGRVSVGPFAAPGVRVPSLY